MIGPLRPKICSFSLDLLRQGLDLEWIATQAHGGQDLIDGHFRSRDDVIAESFAPARDPRVGVDPDQRHVRSLPGFAAQTCVSEGPPLV